MPCDCPSDPGNLSDENDPGAADVSDADQPQDLPRGDEADRSGKSLPLPRNKVNVFSFLVLVFFETKRREFQTSIHNLTSFSLVDGSKLKLPGSIPISMCALGWPLSTDKVTKDESSIPTPTR